MGKSFTYSPKPFKKMPPKSKKLAVEITVYVPNRDKGGKKVPKKEFSSRIKEVEYKLLHLFWRAHNERNRSGRIPL